MFTKITTILALLTPALMLAAPANPSSLKFTNTTAHSVKLSWKDNASDELGYKIFRNDIFLTLTPADTTYFVDTGLTPKTTYTYTVKATDDSDIRNYNSGANSWYLYANSSGAVLENINDQETQKSVVSIKTTNGKSVGIALGANWNTNKHIITWEQKFSGNYKIYIKINTQNGTRYLIYLPNGIDRGLHDGEYIDIGFSISKSENWHRITKDLQSDLKRMEPDNDFISIDRMLVRTYDNGLIGDVIAHDYSSDEKLNISFKNLTSGVELTQILNNNQALLVNNANRPLFIASLRQGTIQGTEQNITAQSGWREVSINKVSSNKQIITLKNPQDTNLPSNLKATITVETKGEKSTWDLQIVGVGSSHILTDVIFPNLNIKTTTNDDFFIPRMFGKVEHNPATNINFSEIYPMGWGASMQYMAYYNKDYGVYFGFHDPKASLKTLAAQQTAGGVIMRCENPIPIPPTTKVANDWDFPGKFELDIFHGDWYDASMLYKTWVYQKADYRPATTPSAAARSLGDISVWGIQTLAADMKLTDIDTITSRMTTLKERSGEDITFGAYWLAPYNQPEYGDDYFNEYQFPKFYPSIEIEHLVSTLNTAKAKTMVYTNTYLYSQEILTSDGIVNTYESMKPYATKQKDGMTPYTQDWSDHDDKPHTYSRMCATQKPWQDILVKIHKEQLSPLHTSGILLDQITASTPVQCYDEHHGHPLGGGHYWRDGYKEFIEKIRQAYPAEVFMISEGVNDSLMDSLDGYETSHSNYVLNNQVPAIQSIYGGKVQFIGPRSSTAYNSKDFYGITAWSFVFGTSLGYLFTDIIYPRFNNALAYLETLAKVKDRLKSYIAFGEMKRALKLEGNIPNITLDRVMNHATIQAIQTATWISEDKQSIAFVFINAQTPDKNALTFSYNFDGKKYGFQGGFTLKEVTKDGIIELGNIQNTFTKEVTVNPADIKAYILTKQ